MTTYMTLQELRKMAAGKKIKKYIKLSKLELAKALNLDETIVCKSPNAKKVLITNSDTKEILKCKSMGQCSKLLCKNIGSISYYCKHGSEFTDKDGNKIRLSFA